MRVVVAGSLAQRTGRGGHAWVFLQYLLGFSRLGHDVLFVDRLEPEMCTGAGGVPCSPERSRELRYLRDTMAAFGFADAFAAVVDGGSRSIGIERHSLLAWVRSADVVLDVMGYLRTQEVLDAAATKVFLDIDPGFTQMWCDLGLHDPRGSHDVYATFGANLGGASCAIPTCGIGWVTTRPPVVLDEWPVRGADRRRLTSVCSWRGPYAPVEYRGVTYGLRAHRLRGLAQLPACSALPLELALDIDDADACDARLLRDAGWRLADPREVAGDPASYRRYVQGSAGELMVAKDMYVRSKSGWFSDRSACYLASGKPVVAQDTGLGALYPVGKGLLIFDDVDGAAAAIDDLVAHYPRHARAARDLAESFFASEVVLPRLLDDLAAA